MGLRLPARMHNTALREGAAAPIMVSGERVAGLEEVKQGSDTATGRDG
jgi:hypothetical protein